MQYMISPMDLTERQLLIYKVLYDRCNFNTMEVSITIENIVNAIKVADFSYDAVYRDINKMIKKGYIIMVRKPAKGVAPIYKLVKINELKSANQVQTKCKPSANQNQVISMYAEGMVQTKCKPSANQVRTNSKDKDNNNIYSRVIDYLNEKASKSFKCTTRKTKSCIDARLREGFKEADFLKVIDIKTEEWKDNPNMNKYLRPETLFGVKFEGYLQQHTKQDQTQQQEIKSLYGANKL